MDHFKKFAKDVILIGVAEVIVGLQAFLLLPILTKFLGATDFGIWSQIKITVSLVGGFALLGLDAAIVRFMSGQEDKKKVSKEFISILSISLVATFIFGLIIFIFSDKIALWLTHIPKASFFFKFIILMLLLDVVYTQFITFFRVKGNIKLFSIIEIIRVILEIGLVYIFLAKEFGLLGVILAFILVKAITILLGLINIKKNINFLKPSFEAIKPYLIFSLPLAITPLLWWIVQLGDQYIIGYFIGAKAVGIYALAYSLCYIIRFLCEPFFLILLPSLSRVWDQSDKEAAKVYFKYSYKYIFMLVIPAAVGLSLLAEPILKIISTEEFLEGRILIPIIAAGFALYIFFQLTIILLMLNKETKKITKILTALAIVNIFLNILLVPVFGALGAAITTLITFGIAAVVGAVIIKSQKFELMGKFLLTCLFSSGLMGVIILVLRNMLFINVILKMIIIISASVTIYFLVLYLMKCFSKEELIFFKKLILDIRNNKVN